MINWFVTGQAYHLSIGRREYTLKIHTRHIPVDVSLPVVVDVAVVASAVSIVVVEV